MSIISDGIDSTSDISGGSFVYSGFGNDSIEMSELWGATIRESVKHMQPSLNQLIDCKKTREKIRSSGLPLVSLSISQNGNTKIDPLNGDYPIVWLDGRETTYALKSIISKGAYGGVYLLELIEEDNRKHPDLPQYLSIKYPFFENGLDRDLNVYYAIMGKDDNDVIIDSCHLIIDGHFGPMKELKEEINALLMEKMDGNLSKFNLNAETDNTLTPLDHYAIYFNILLQLAHSFNILLENGYYYTDAKLANILYRVLGRGQLEIFLGDYGSASPAGKSLAITTYPYIYRSVAYEFKPHTADLIYGLFIMFLELNQGHFNKRDLRQLAHDVKSSPEDKIERIMSIKRQIDMSIADSSKWDWISGQYSKIHVNRLQSINTALVSFILSENLLLNNEREIWKMFQVFLMQQYDKLVHLSPFGKHLQLPGPIQKAMLITGVDVPLSPDTAHGISPEHMSFPEVAAYSDKEGIVEEEAQEEYEEPGKGGLSWIDWMLGV